VTATVTDRQTGVFIARSTVRLVQPGLDATPTRFYGESPAVIRDRDVEGYIATATAEVGAAADSHYVAQYPTSAILAQAVAKYNAGQWQEALTDFTTAANRPNGQNARTLAGLYLTNVKIRRPREAEIIFGRLATLGLTTKSFAVKMLFRANSSTEFWPGPEHADVYPMWIRQIARSAQTANVCINIVGHTSRSGTAEVNDRISVARAQTVKRLLEAQVRALAPRLSAAGVGYRENIVGTGSDDAVDAIDRRVEFKVVACPSR
jgi:outer membrane protein OmpA-like peptidoglycan-associated protein